MVWKGSVKAVSFVLGLEEHFIKRSNPGVDQDATRHDDDWALDYLDFAHVRPVLEAIDEDGTGYISTYEANAFTCAMPESFT
jgi:hypothetical protein